MTIKELFDRMDYGPAPEGNAEAKAWLAKHGQRFGHFIDGAFTPAGVGFATRNPATGAELAVVTQGSAADVDRAVAAARRAQGQRQGAHPHPPWRAAPGARPGAEHRERGRP